MTILVAYDGSEQSDYALEMATTAFPDEQLCLAHIVEPTAEYGDAGGFSATIYQQEFDNAETMLQEVAADLPDGQSATTVVRYGRPVHELLSIAEDEGVEHIVIGSHGRDGAKRLLLGSVAETVARRSPVPVTVVRNQPTAKPPERVVVPFDDSEPARAALSFAAEQYPDADITALYAVYPPSEVTGAGEAALGDIEDWADRLDEHTETVLGHAASAADRNITTDTVNGNPAAAIVEYADEHADHIVMGSHGRDGLSRLIMGSVAETVVRRSPTSVTVVREQSED